MGEAGGPAVIGLAQAARMLGIHRQTAYKLVRRDAFPVPVLLVGNRYKVPILAIEEYLAGKPQ